MFNVFKKITREKKENFSLNGSIILEYFSDMVLDVKLYVSINDVINIEVSLPIYDAIDIEIFEQINIEIKQEDIKNALYILYTVT